MPHEQDISFKSIGETFSNNATVDPSSEVFFPSVTIDLKKFPELNIAEINDEVEIYFISKVTSISTREKEGESTAEMRLELRKAAIYRIGSVVKQEGSEHEDKKAKDPISDADRELSKMSGHA